MRLLVFLLIGSTAAGCSGPADASREQLTAAITGCGVARVDVRRGATYQTSWVWYWSYEDGVENRKMNCVRDALAGQKLKADFYDRSVAGGARS